MLHMGMVLDEDRGWQTRTLSFPVEADDTVLEEECAQVVEAVKTMESIPGAEIPEKSWWAPAQPWGAS